MDANTTATAATEAIITNMREEHFLYGGDLMEITRLLGDLEQKYVRQGSNKTGNGDFMVYMFALSDSLVHSSVGWREISRPKLRHSAASRILASLDQVGFIYLGERAGCEEHTKTFTQPRHNINVQLAKRARSQITADTCFNFKENTICLPLSAIENIEDNCISTVATFLNFENREAGLLPQFAVFPLGNQSYLTGLSVNNGTEVNIPQDEKTVQVTFHHPSNEVRFKSN